MNTWLRLLLPVALGACAAFINSTVMQQKLEPRSFVVVSRDVRAGDVFTPANIRVESFSGNVASLLNTAVPWEEQAVILGREVPRDLFAGDLVLWRDATPPARELEPEEGEASLPVSLAGVDIVPRLLLVGEQIGFFIDGARLQPTKTTRIRPQIGGLNITGSSGIDIPVPQIGGTVEPEYVGPFRVLSVGQRLTRTEDEDESGANIENRIITVAIRLDQNNNPDPDATRLLKAAKSRGSSSRSGLLAVVLHRSKRSPGSLRQRYGIAEED